MLGILAGYLGGWLDAVINWITDLALAMPFLIFALALVPTVALRFYGPREEVPPAFQVAVLIGDLRRCSAGPAPPGWSAGR